MVLLPSNKRGKSELLRKTGPFQVLHSHWHDIYWAFTVASLQTYFQAAQIVPAIV